MQETTIRGELELINAKEFNYPATFGFLLCAVLTWVEGLIGDEELERTAAVVQSVWSFAVGDGSHPHDIASSSGSGHFVSLMDGREIRQIIKKAEEIPELNAVAFELLSDVCRNYTVGKMTPGEFHATSTLVRVLWKKRMEAIIRPSTVGVRNTGAETPGT